jgi:hypothetical protein
MPDQGFNATHWTLSIVCRGCSQWPSAGGYTTNINPSNVVWIATAINFGPAGTSTVQEPNSTDSSFNVHDWVARFGFDMAQAKQTNFDSIVNQVRPKSVTDPIRRRHQAFPRS